MGPSRPRLLRLLVPVAACQVAPAPPQLAAPGAAAPPPPLPFPQSRNPGAGVLGALAPLEPLGGALAPLPELPPGGPSPGGPAPGGAAPAAEPPGAVAATGFDCNAGGPWSGNQKNWCCSNKGLGCDSDFDCRSDIAHAASWPDEQTRYCCENEGRGCELLLPEQPAAGAADPPEQEEAEPAGGEDATPSLPPGYCEDGFDDLANWSAAKKDFCCQNEGKGCPPGAGNASWPGAGNESGDATAENTTSAEPPEPGTTDTPLDEPEGFNTTTAEPTLPGEDADVKHVVVVEKADSSAPAPNATAPSEGSATAPEENATAPETTAGEAICASNCTLDDMAFPCLDRLLWAAAHTFGGDSDACDSAHRLVVAQCPMCAGCTPLQSGCLGAEGAEAPAPLDEAANHSHKAANNSHRRRRAAANHSHQGGLPETGQDFSPECNVSCTFKSAASSCRDRLHWAAKFLFPGEANACQAAYGVVLKECDDCSGCSAELAGCTDNASAARSGGAHGDDSKGGGAKGAEAQDHKAANDTSKGGGAKGAGAEAQDDKAANDTSKGGGANGAKAQGDEAAVQPGLVGFDCNAGIKKWERGWSDEKKEWCCSHHNKGCVTTVTTTTFTTSTDDGFDCSDGYYNWQRGWSEEKKAWCCEQEKRACPVGDSSKGGAGQTHRDAHQRRRHGHRRRAASSTATSTSPTAASSTATSTATSTTSPAPYNCDEGYTDRKTSWAPEKKRWCCEFEAVGCSDEALAEPASEVNGSSSDADAANASGPDHAEGNGSNASTAPTPAPSKTAPKTAPKNASKTASKTAPKTAPKNASDSAPTPAPTAATTTTTAATTATTTAATTTAATTTTGRPAPWDCEDSASDPAQNWTVSRKAWCCSHARSGCPDIKEPTPQDDSGPGSEETTSNPFDCRAGFNNWEAGWSGDKKTWCCDHERRGCSGTSAPYDCSAGFKNWEAGWSTNKKAWCCEHEEKACAPEAPGGAEELLDQLSANHRPSRLFLEHDRAGEGVATGRSGRSALGRQSFAALAAAGVGAAAAAAAALSLFRCGGRAQHELRTALPLRRALAAGEPSGAYAELQAQPDCAEAVSLAE